MLHRYLSFGGRISRKEFLYGFLEVYLFGLICCLPLTIIFAGMKSSGAPQIMIQGFALILIALLSICLWTQCALLVKRGHDRGLPGTPMLGVLAFTLFIMGNGVLEVIGGESYMYLIFPKDRDNHLAFNAIFFAFGIYLNFLFWSGLKKGSATGAEEFGPPPTPDEDVGFWTVK
jgi:uncharacterized membrane protein YhaH (DUF805 family)